MTENMLTIDRLFDFGVLGFHDTCRLSVIGVVRALSGAISDRLSDIGVLEELTRFHIQQNIRLYGAYTFFNCCRLPIWHKKTRGPIFSVLLLGDLCDCEICCSSRFAEVRGLLQLCCAALHRTATHCGHQQLQRLQEAMLRGSSFFVPLEYAGVF